METTIWFYCLMTPFCYELWPIRHHMLPLDAIFDATIIKVDKGELTLIVIVNHMWALLCLHLYLHLDFLTVASVSLLATSNATHMYLLWSSTNRRYYHLPLVVANMMGLQKSSWTRSIIHSAHRFVCYENVLFFILVVIQSMQSWWTWST
jgi:hypothetical protein